MHMHYHFFCPAPKIRAKITFQKYILGSNPEIPFPTPFWPTTFWYQLAPLVIIIPQLKQFLFILVKATDLLFHRDWLGQSPTRRCFTQPVTTQPRQFFGGPKNIYFSIFITIWPMPMKNARCFFFISFVFWTNMFWHVFYMSCI